MGAGFALILREILSRLFVHFSMETDFAALLTLNLAPQFLGGITAAILIQRKLKTDPVKNGAKIGASSMVIYMVITGQVNLYMMPSFLLGSYIGGIVGERMLRSSQQI